MPLGLLGRKVGMTRIFLDKGDSVPVTVIDVSENRLMQLKTVEKNGYAAAQVAFGLSNVSRLSKPVLGAYKKLGVEPAKLVREFRLFPADDPIDDNFVLSLEIFSIGQKVDVSGFSIGKGYAGTIKRYNFSSGRASHGNSRSHNVPGSIGMAQDPGRVFPGKKMTGRMGGNRVTVQNIEVVRLDLVRQLIFIKGSVPGCKKSLVTINPAVKKRKS